MVVNVGKHEISIVADTINEKEVNITHCTFTFDEDITSDFIKEAYFTKNGSTYKVIIDNDECDLPNEILVSKGKVELGVSYYKIDDNIVTRYNPSPAYFYILEGSLKENTKNGIILKTPSELEYFESEIQDYIDTLNIDIDVSKTGKVATVTATNSNGEHHTVEIYDGVDGKDGEQGPEGPEGKQGPQGETGPQGPEGPAGKDGQNGRDGTNGQDGKDGYTPVKGVDYFTQEDIASLNIPDDLGDLTNSAGYIKGLVQLTYGTSTWNDFKTAYDANKIVYCYVNGRMAFMAYVSSTNVEFQYYRSLSSPSASSQADEVYVYKLTNGNVWSTTTRNASSSITAGTGLTRTYTTNTRTVDLSVDTTTIATKQYVDNAIGTALNNNY